MVPLGNFPKPNVWPKFVFFLPLNPEASSQRSQYQLYPAIKGYWSLADKDQSTTVIGNPRWGYGGSSIKGIAWNQSTNISLLEAQALWAAKGISLSFFWDPGRLDPLDKNHYLGLFWLGQGTNPVLALYANKVERFYHLKVGNQFFNSSFDRIFDHQARLITLTWEKDQLRLWDNAQLVLVQTLARPEIEETPNFWLGHTPKTVEAPQGRLSQLAWFSRALNSEEIAGLVRLHHTQGVSRFTGWYFGWAEKLGADLNHPWGFWWFFEGVVFPLLLLLSLPLGLPFIWETP